MGCATLLGLPVELLKAICTLLCDHCMSDWKSDQELCHGPLPVVGKAYTATTATLVEMSKTCRLLRSVATPFLCHDLYHPLLDGLPVRQVVLPLCHYPELAAHVRRFAFECAYAPGDEWGGIEEQAIQHGITPPAEWQPNVEDDQVMVRVEDPDHLVQSVGILFALFMSRAAKLEYLDLEMEPVVDYASFLLPTTTLHSMIMLNVRFRDCHIDEYYSPRYYDLRRILPLLQQMPYLKSLRLEYCFSIPSSVHLGNLKYLKLKDSYVKPSELKGFIEQCPKLESFIFHSLAYLATHVPDIRSYRPRSIIESLSSRKDSLRHFELQCRWLFNRNEPGTFITSLKQFTALETVILSMDCIMDAHQPYFHLTFDEIVDYFRADPDTNRLLIRLLPASIRTVVIEGFGTQLYAPILGLLRQPGISKFPHLEKFTLVKRDHFRADGTEFLVSEIGDSDVSFEISTKTAFDMS